MTTEDTQRRKHNHYYVSGRTALSHETKLRRAKSNGSFYTISHKTNGVSQVANITFGNYRSVTLLLTRYNSYKINTLQHFILFLLSVFILRFTNILKNVLALQTVI